MAKAKSTLHSLVCHTCAEVSWLVVGGKYDGFIRHGCRHSVQDLLKILLEKELKTRKKKAVRIAGNPTGKKRKKA